MCTSQTGSLASTWLRNEGLSSLAPNRLMLCLYVIFGTQCSRSRRCLQMHATPGAHGVRCGGSGAAAVALHHARTFSRCLRGAAPSARWPAAAACHCDCFHTRRSGDSNLPHPCTVRCRASAGGIHRGQVNSSTDHRVYKHCVVVNRAPDPCVQPYAYSITVFMISLHHSLWQTQPMTLLCLCE
jgi:hypothetical protein